MPLVSRVIISPLRHAISALLSAIQRYMLERSACARKEGARCDEPREARERKEKNEPGEKRGMSET